VGLHQLAEQGAAVFRVGLRPRLDDCGDRRLGFLDLALLHGELFLHLDQRLTKLEIVGFRAGRMRKEDLPDLDPCPQNRENRLKLLDRRSDGCELGLLLRLLTIEGSELGAMLVELMHQKLPLRRDLRRACAFRRMERRREISPVAERGREPRNVEFRGDEIALKMLLSAWLMVGSSSIRTSPASTL
jgi:hypothetical protein